MEPITPQPQFQPPPQPQPVTPEPQTSSIWKVVLITSLCWIVVGFVTFLYMSDINLVSQVPKEEIYDDYGYSGGDAGNPWTWSGDTFTYPDYNISFNVPDEVRGGGMVVFSDSSGDWQFHFNSEATSLEAMRNPNNDHIYDIAFSRTTYSLIDRHSYGSGVKKNINGIEYRLGGYNVVVGNNLVQGVIDIYETSYGGFYYIFSTYFYGDKNNAEALEKMLSTLKFIQ